MALSPSRAAAILAGLLLSTAPSDEAAVAELAAAFSATHCSLSMPISEDMLCSTCNLLQHGGHSFLLSPASLAGKTLRAGRPKLLQLRRYVSAGVLVGPARVKLPLG